VRGQRRRGRVVISQRVICRGRRVLKGSKRSHLPGLKGIEPISWRLFIGRAHLTHDRPPTGSPMARGLPSQRTARRWLPTHRRTPLAGSTARLANSRNRRPVAVNVGRLPRPARWPPRTDSSGPSDCRSALLQPLRVCPGRSTRCSSGS
jgi:hypothetical protein